MRFTDRRQAGVALGQALLPYVDQHPVVLGLPRGGVVLAAEVARTLQAPLDVIVVRKLGVPWQPELAMGAIGEDAVRVLNGNVLSQLQVSDEVIGEVERRERAVIAERSQQLRGARQRVDLTDRCVIVVDDGIATGATARAACEVARAHGALRVVLAVPVAPAGWDSDHAAVADDFVCLTSPRNFGSVGEWYEDFRPVSDDKVSELLAASTRLSPSRAAMQFRLPDVTLLGDLCLPTNTNGLVVFAHGSGSSRLSPRNTYVAARLNDLNLGTLLFDLLTDDEAKTKSNVFDVELLGQRLAAVSRLALREVASGRLPLGYFGASTGAAAALWAAAEADLHVGAVVSRGGRPDLTPLERVHAVSCPTLLIVGSRDLDVRQLNEKVSTELTCPHLVQIVPGASHLFEEPGAMDRVTQLAGDWFTTAFVSGAKR